MSLEGATRPSGSATNCHHGRKRSHSVPEPESAPRSKRITGHQISESDDVAGHQHANYGMLVHGGQHAARDINIYPPAINEHGTIPDSKIEKLARLLDFAERTTRELQLDDTEIAEETYNWIFETGELSCGLASWLASSEPVFWIQGKPGSGKSTLMNFLSKSHDVQQLLPSNDIETWTIVRFFFDFRSSTNVANTTEGCLRSLICQLLEDSRVATTLASRKAEFQVSSAVLQKSMSRLKMLLTQVLQTAKPRLCFFIDGVDEIGSSTRDLTQLVSQLMSIALQSSVHLKICIASRPGNQIEALFADHPTFRLQDYNSSDIIRFVHELLRETCLDSAFTDRLAKALRDGSNHNAEVNTLTTQEARIEDVAQLVCEKAEGVFIWARFAMYDLWTTYIDGGSYEDMLDELSNLPPDLHALYERIFAKISPEHQLESGILLQLVASWPHRLTQQVYGRGISIDHIFDALDYIYRGNESEYPSVPEDIRVERHRRLRARTGGLLEIYTVHYYDSGLITWCVRLVHKSVKDYLTQAVLPATTLDLSLALDPTKLGVPYLHRALRRDILTDEPSWQATLFKMGITASTILNCDTLQHAAEKDYFNRLTFLHAWVRALPELEADFERLNGRSCNKFTALLYQEDFAFLHRALTKCFCVAYERSLCPEVLDCLKRGRGQVLCMLVDHGCLLSFKEILSSSTSEEINIVLKWMLELAFEGFSTEPDTLRSALEYIMPPISRLYPWHLLLALLIYDLCDFQDLVKKYSRQDHRSIATTRGLLPLRAATDLVRHRIADLQPFDEDVELISKVEVLESAGFEINEDFSKWGGFLNAFLSIVVRYKGDWRSSPTFPILVNAFWRAGADMQIRGLAGDLLSGL